MENQDREFEELKIVIEIGREYFGFYLRAVIFLLTVLGVFLKLFWDSKSGSGERFAIFVAGQLGSIGGIIVTLVAYPKYRLVAHRCKELTELLRIPDVYFPGTITVANAFLLILIIVSILWTFLYKIL
jgi:hypothetical protein